MGSRKSGIWVGLLAVAVIGIAAIVFYSSRTGPVLEEEATGAIGAAERHRVEQISDEDVILDITGQEQIADAIFETLTDEQKAELLGRVGENARTEIFSRFEMNEAKFEELGRQELGRQELGREAVALLRLGRP